MKNNLLYPDTINIFKNEKLEFRVSRINDEGTNIKEVFEANLINYIHNYKKFSDNSELAHLFNSEWIYNEFINGLLHAGDKSSIGCALPCNEFIRFEFNKFQNESEPKCKKYLHFIQTHFDTFNCIDSLSSHYHRQNKPLDTFRIYARGKMQIENINFTTIENSFYRLEKLISKTALIDLIQNLHFTKTESYEKEIKQVFDMDYFLNPALILNPNEKINYQQAIIAWVNKIIQDLKFNHNLPEIPPIASWLLIEIENRKLTSVINEEIKEYPKHVFLNYKAFNLFDILAKEMTTHPQISFLFRQMNEKEKPQLIVVENSDFIKWFNHQQYNLTIDYATKTYEQSKTEDRLVLYNVVKSLKINN
jgi:hypothetical protein